MKIVKIIKIVLVIICCVTVVASSIPIVAGCTADYALYTIKQITNWKKTQVGLQSTDYLLNDEFLKNAGNGIDWYVIALSRVGIEDNYNNYLNSITNYITEKYKTADKLSAKKATEWHRIALAVLAAGGDATKIGTDLNGNSVNLIKDGVCNRNKLASQGLNGVIWGLITLDSLGYSTADDCINTRDSIITEIMANQLSDGGFNIAGTLSNVDITADAVVALAPYYNENILHTYINKKSKTKEIKAVSQIIDESLAFLSNAQNNTGGFSSWGTENSESISKVITACCAVGINPDTDSRFIKNGKTPIDALLSYQNQDGGISHIYKNGSNSMAGEQAICAMASYFRLKNNMNRLYDFSAEPIITTDTVIDGDSKPNYEKTNQSNNQNNGDNNKNSNKINNQEHNVTGNGGSSAENAANNEESHFVSSSNNKSKTTADNSKIITNSGLSENKNSTKTEQSTTQSQDGSEKGDNISLICIAIGIIIIFGSVAWGVKKNKTGRTNDFNPLSIDREEDLEIDSNVEIDKETKENTDILNDADINNKTDN